jgi:hypothetical protein
MPDGKTRVLHPAFIAVWPVLHLFAANIEEAPVPDAVAPLAGALLYAAVFYLLFRMLRFSSPQAGLLVSLLVVLTFSFTAVHDALIAANDQLGIEMLAAYGLSVRHGVALGVLVVILLLGVLLIRRARGDLSRLTGLLNWISAALVLLALFRIGTGLSTHGDPPPPLDPVAVTGVTERPDVYYLVPDRYPSEETLREVYGFDNRPFLAALRERGFAIASQSRANYGKTLLSLSAALDMEFLPEVVEERAAIERLKAGHRVGAFFKGAGYRYLHLGSWYGPTAENDLADAIIQYPGGLTEFAGALLGMTPFKSFLGLGLLYEDHHRIGRFQFERLLALTPSATPRFVFVHLLLPHGPLVFDREGNVIPEIPEFGPGSKARFVDQLSFVNDRLLQVVDHLEEISKEPPIIVLAADEGPYLREDDKNLDRETKRNIRTGILTAVKGPGLESTDLPPTLSPVNLFRLVLTRWFGQDLPLLEDRVFTFQGLLQPEEEDGSPFRFE